MNVSVSKLIEQGRVLDLEKENLTLKKRNEKLASELDELKGNKSHAALKRENLALKSVKSILTSKNVIGFNKVIMRDRLKVLDKQELLDVAMALKVQIHEAEEAKVETKLKTDKEIGRGIQIINNNHNKIGKQEATIKSLKRQIETLEKNDIEQKNAIKKLTQYNCRVVQIANSLKKERNEKTLELKVAMGFIRDCCGEIGVPDN